MVDTSISANPLHPVRGKSSSSQFDGEFRRTQYFILKTVNSSEQIKPGQAVFVVNLSATICAVRINASSSPASMSRSPSYSAGLRSRCACSRGNNVPLEQNGRSFQHAFQKRVSVGASLVELRYRVECGADLPAQPFFGGR